MKLVLYNITYHDCPVQIRETVAFTPDQCHQMLRQMHAEPSVSEAAVISTCNRIEFYLYAKKSFDTAAFITSLVEALRPDALENWKKHSRQYQDIDVVTHLFEVAAGLDSQMLGENQVLAQVKAAYTMSIDARMSRFLFHHLFHNAFRVGKAVRTRTYINCGAVSVSLAAVELAQKQLNLQAVTAMLIGAGENAELAAHYLVKAGLKNLIIANRSLENAGQMQTRLGAGRVISLDDIQPELAHIDLLITSTAAEHPLVTFRIAEPVLKNRVKKLLIVDIAVPRDVDPDLAKFACVSLHNIDDLDRQVGQNRQKRCREIPKAQQIVAEFTDAFAKWYASLDLVPVITDLTQKGLDLARAEAKRYAADFGPDTDKKLRLFAESLVRKILHGPITFLKSVEGEPTAEQLQAVDLINKMFLSQDKTQQ